MKRGNLKQVRESYSGVSSGKNGLKVSFFIFPVLVVTGLMTRLKLFFVFILRELLINKLLLFYPEL